MADVNMSRIARCLSSRQASRAEDDGNQRGRTKCRAMIVSHVSPLATIVYRVPSTVHRQKYEQEIKRSEVFFLKIKNS
jgi:hypothetical protein